MIWLLFTLSGLVNIKMKNAFILTVIEDMVQAREIISTSGLGTQSPGLWSQLCHRGTKGPVTPVTSSRPHCLTEIITGLALPILQGCSNQAKGHTTAFSTPHVPMQHVLKVCGCIFIIYLKRARKTSIPILVFPERDVKTDP